MNAREQSSISAAVAGDTAIGSGWVDMGQVPSLAFASHRNVPSKVSSCETPNAVFLSSVPLERQQCNLEVYTGQPIRNEYGEESTTHL